MSEVGEQGDAAQPTELERKIARQIEYYFGDANLKRDRFLQLQIREDDGWVPLETMIKFNRLKILTTDFDLIVRALELSTIGLMEVSEDKLKIRRAPTRPLPEESTAYWRSLRARSVYCKGFKVDEGLDTIQEFMDQFGKCVHIQMRRDKEKKFKGSIFAIYDSEESAKNFVEAESAKLHDEDAIRMSKEDYFKMKAEERKTLREDEKKRKEEEREQKERDQVEAMQSEFDSFEKGCVLYFSGANDQTSREDLKELFSEHGTIQWVDFVRGQTEGTIRFAADSKAQETLDKALAAAGGEIKLRGCDLTFRVLEGEEEEEHWQKVFEDKSRARLKKQQGRRGRRQKGFQRRERGDRPQGKKTKFESDDEDENGAEEEAPKGVKRSFEDDAPEPTEEPAVKKEKTEDS